LFFFLSSCEYLYISYNFLNRINCIYCILFYYVMTLVYKFKCDLTMCADSANVRDTTIALAQELGKHDVDDDVYERHATTLHEAYPRYLREVSSRGSGKERIL